MPQTQHNATNLTVLGAASLSTTLPVVGSVLGCVVDLRPTLRVPDLDPVPGADDHDLAIEPDRLPEVRGQRHATLGVLA